MPLTKPLQRPRLQTPEPAPQRRACRRNSEVLAGQAGAGLDHGQSQLQTSGQEIAMHTPVDYSRYQTLRITRRGPQDSIIDL